LTLITKSTLSKSQATIYCDRSKIGQILNNLLNNALKFTAKGQIALTCSLNREMLEFVVKDTGIGIEKSKQQRIFDRFAQADDFIRRDYGGTGLGLSICKGFVELMGGQIWLESEPGTGSAFYFTIPYRPALSTSETLAGQYETRHQGEQFNILVAEDEESNFLLLQLVLKKLN